jgi:hypothetical protein
VARDRWGREERKKNLENGTRSRFARFSIKGEKEKEEDSPGDKDTMLALSNY